MEAAAQAPNEEPPGASNKDESARFECNICLDAAKDAVVSMCGHLFCWPCLSQWLDTRPTNQVCPVCKSAIDGSKVVPIYGRGGDSSDPRAKIPPRPKGQRTEPPPQSPFGNFNWGAFNNEMGGGGGGLGGTNVHFSFGIGIFPLSFFASFFGNGTAAGERNNQDGSGGVGGEGDAGAHTHAHAHGPGQGHRGPETAAPGSRMAEEDEYLQNIFKYIGFFMLFWLLFV